MLRDRADRAAKDSMPPLRTELVNGAWVVHGLPSASLLRRDLDAPVDTDSAGELTFDVLSVEAKNELMLAAGDKRDRYIEPGRAAELVVNSSREKRRRIALPEWPALDRMGWNPTPRVQELVASWRPQWERLRGALLRRCEQPTCGVSGGRYFIANTQDRDCKYCRRSTPAVTRWRRRREDGAWHRHN